jgi:hypothetical protein
MNRNQFTLLLCLLVVLGIAGLMIYHRQNAASRAGNSTAGDKLIAQFPINDVARIHIKQGTNELNLANTDIWRVRERKDYPANYSQIGDFMMKLNDMKVVQSEKVVDPSDLARLALAAGQGSNVVVELSDQNGKVIKSILLGKTHRQKPRGASPFGDTDDAGYPDGRYVMVGTNSSTVALISDPLSTVEPRPEQWLDKGFFKVEKIRSVSVAYPEATNSWKVTHQTETSPWQLGDATPTEQLDATKITTATSQLGSPSFIDVDTTSQPEQLGLDKPTVVTVDTFEDFAYTFKIGQLTNNNYPLSIAVAAQLAKERTPGQDEKAEDKAKLDKEFKDKQQKLQDKLTKEKGYEKWNYLVSNWTLDPLLKRRAELLVEKKEEVKKDSSANPAGDLLNPAELIQPAATNSILDMQLVPPSTNTPPSTNSMTNLELTPPATNAPAPSTSTNTAPPPGGP